MEIKRIVFEMHSRIGTLALSLCLSLCSANCVETCFQTEGEFYAINIPNTFRRRKVYTLLEMKAYTPHTFRPNENKKTENVKEIERTRRKEREPNTQWANIKDAYTNGYIIQIREMCA